MVALFFCGDLKYCPYMSRYIERLDALKIAYRVYFWNRSGEAQDFPDNYIYYNNQSDLGKSLFGKLFDFEGFRKWCIHKIREDQPDKLILLSTLMGVMICDFLKKTDIPYVFDVRDYSFECFPPFKWMERQVVRNSVFTAISSRGFQAFLPKHEYVIAHNFNRNDKKREHVFQKREDPIKIVWNGVMRYFEYQKQYIDQLANDPRFLMIYHGDGPALEQYKEYCKGEKITNVLFTGAYNNADKEDLLADADVLNNCYGYLKHAGSKLKYAVSNKFYDGAIYHIPQLVEPSGFKTDWVHKAGIGVSFVADDSFADRLYEYCKTLNVDTFNAACEKVYEEVLKEDQQFISAIDTFVQ